ncbi:(d)CMP kinase [Nocardioides sp. HDW12B]|uniref:(d)CMP kinase n=1 Tax=Nocardioides sp. HDW12B TaxID=2714939 RepID=UPI001F110FE7|nr:(d)CMP kinase [Nocardioides sp. HDW12B]
MPGPTDRPSDRPATDAPSPVVVAVDGTSGSGKSSTSRAVASRLGLRYLDTGAQFRAMTWWMLQHGVDVHDADAVASHAGTPVIESGTDPADPTITVDGEDASVAIRTTEVTGAVSPVSTVAEVRTRLLGLQREIIGAGDGVGIVVEGRDIGSVVWPTAEVKLYLSADASARAQRRTAEHAHLGDVTSTQAQLLERDTIDSGRVTAPLVQADGALAVDTTHLTLDEVVDLVVGLVEEHS